MDFKNVEKKYRPIPFWSWNEKLDTAETKRQIKLMDEAGIGGYFMHARGGLQTEYLGEEWFDNIKASIDEGNERGMYSWAYDENGWPSGFGNGAVNGMGVEYQQKYLRMSDTEPTENVIAKCGEHWFYFDVNPFYVDVLDKKVIAEFIKVAYEPYYERYGNDFEGFFTDEPQISRNGIPYSFAFESEYKARYGENINEHLEELFLTVGDYKSTRIKFWKMVTDMFSNAFCKQIYDWCESKGLKLTGHLVLEESLSEQITTNGTCMPHYEYFHIPGMDWLGRVIFDCLTPMQVSSVAQQMGQSQVLSETFALCGHNVSLAELKGIYEWQMVHGINMLCQHLEGYSLRGIRKRDYPPAMYYQQPWWSEYKHFNDAMSRVGKVLSTGKAKADVLLLHPMSTAWTMFDNENFEGIDKLNKKLLDTMKLLESKHIIYHLGDETMLERHGRVENGQIVIGTQKYDMVIDNLCEELLDNTKALLDEFKKQGGKTVTAEELSASDVTDNCEITYTKRIGDGYTAHYFVNTSAERKLATINVDGKMLDIYTGDLHDFDGNHEFEPWGSLMIIEDGSKNTASTAKTGKTVRLDGELRLAKPVQNMMTLDRCDYYFDGELVEKDGYVLNITERANALERGVKIHQDYKVAVADIPNKLELVCETPQKYTIKVNGNVVENKPNGWVVDKSFEKIDITQYLKIGENVISFDCDFKQDDSVYENLNKAKIFESEKNKLVYDMEIEAVYLLGEFAVQTSGEWETLEKNASRYKGDFVITKQVETIKPSHIEKQGYPFFCGTMELEGEIEFAENDILEFDMRGISTIKIEIGKTEKILLTDNRISLSEFNVSGKQKIKLTVTNNLRNLLGPHHLAEGESFHVGPSCFFKEPCIWNDFAADDSQKGYGGQAWNDDFCFCDLSL